MKEESNITPEAVPEESDTDIVSILKGMQKQLLFLEKKIDSLLSQSKERSSAGNTSPDRPFRKRPFSKPFRSFEHTPRHGKEERERAPRERDAAKGHFYEHRPHEKSPGRGPRNKSFSSKRKDKE
jgi:hypothetical protein